MDITHLFGDVKSIPGNQDGRYEIKDAILESGDAFSVKIVDKKDGEVITLALDSIRSDEWTVGQKVGGIGALPVIEAIALPVKEQDLRREVKNPTGLLDNKYLLFLVGIVDKVREIVFGQPDKWETVNPAIPESMLIPEELTHVDYSDGYGIVVVDAKNNGKQREIHLNKANEFFSITKAEMPVFEMSFLSKDGINDSLKCDLSKVDGSDIGVIVNLLSEDKYSDNTRAKQAFADMLKLTIGYLDPAVPGTDFILTCSSVAVTRSSRSSDVCIYPMVYKVLNIGVNPDSETGCFSEQFIYDRVRLERLVLSLERARGFRGDSFIARHYSEILDTAKKALREMRLYTCDSCTPATEKQRLHVTTCTKYNHETGFYESFEVTGQMPKELIDKLLDVIRQETGK